MSNYLYLFSLFVVLSALRPGATADNSPSPLDGFHSSQFLNNPNYQINQNVLHKNPLDRPSSNQNGKLNKVFQLLFQSQQNSQQQQQQQQGPPPNGMQGPPPNGMQGPPPNNSQQRPPNGPPPTNQQGPPNGQQGPFNGSNLPNGPPPSGFLPLLQNNGSTFIPLPPFNVNTNSSQPAPFKDCKSIKTMSSFDINKALGKWFVLALWNSVNQMVDVACIQQTVSLANVNNVSSVVFNTVNTFANKTTKNDTVTISQQSFTNGSDVLKLVDTDYSNYAIVVACAGPVQSVIVAVRSANSTYNDATVLARLGNDLSNLLGLQLAQIPRVGRTGCSAS